MQRRNGKIKSEYSGESECIMRVMQLNARKHVSEVRCAERETEERNVLTVNFSASGTAVVCKHIYYTLCESAMFSTNESAYEGERIRARADTSESTYERVSLHASAALRECAIWSGIQCRRTHTQPSLCVRKGARSGKLDTYLLTTE